MDTFEKLDKVLKVIKDLEHKSEIEKYESEIKKYKSEIEKKLGISNIKEYIDDSIASNDSEKLDEVLNNELARSKRFSYNFSFMLIDIDYFKMVNDTYGHQVGDDFLVEFTELISNNSRSTDSFFRWGGEEFVMICPEVDKEKILIHADKLRQKVELHKFKTVGNKTISIGITLSKNDDTIDSLVHRADEALYMAKNSGRNKIVFA